MTIKELNAIPNGWGSDGARKVCIEWLKVKLKYEIFIKPDVIMQRQRENKLNRNIDWSVRYKDPKMSRSENIYNQ